jgi:hypothetical protein
MHIAWRDMHCKHDGNTIGNLGKQGRKTLSFELLALVSKTDMSKKKAKQGCRREGEGGKAYAIGSQDRHTKHCNHDVDVNGRKRTLVLKTSDT